MALEIKANDKLDFSEIFPDKPTGQVKEILSGAMSNEYKQEINFHGNRKEIFNFLDEILYDFPEKNSLQINFDKETGFESVYINDRNANFKTKNLNILEMKEIMENVLHEIYELTIENGNCTFYSVNPDEYTITSKGKTIDEKIVETMIEDMKSYYEPTVTTENGRTLEYQVENAFDTVQSVKFISPSAGVEEYIFNYSSSDQNGVESSFVEQIEKIAYKFPNFNFKKEINEPYFDENRYKVENYLKIDYFGNVNLYGIPKNLENEEAGKTFRDIKKLLEKQYNDDKEIFTVRPEFGLKALEGPQKIMETFDDNDHTQYAFSGTIKYEHYGTNEIKKLDSENTFMESTKLSLFSLWKDFQKYKEYTDDTFEISSRASHYSISDCDIDGFESFYIVATDKIAAYDVLNFSKEKDLKLLVTNNTDFSPYCFKNNETWALIENKNIKIAMSEENFNNLIEENGSEKKAVKQIFEETGLENTKKIFKNAEIQIYKNNENWNDNFFTEKGMKKKIVLKEQEENIKTEKNNKIR